MRGNFSRLDRTLEKLDHIKTKNIRTLLNQEELMFLHTDEADFNDRFRNEAAGSSALLGVDDEQEEDEEELKKPELKFHAQLSSGNIDKDMQRELLL